MECPKCGAENRGDAQFCGVCSFPFAEPAPDAPAPKAAVISTATSGAAARSVDRGPGTPENVEREQDDPFHAARMEEREWHEKHRRLIEEAGGAEAYEAGILERLVASRRRRRMQSVVFESILLVGATAGLAVAVSYAQDWARVMTSMPGPSATSGAPAIPGPGVGQAFGIAIAMLVGSSILGTAVARLGRKSLWGVLAAIIAVGVQVALLSPYVTMRSGSPIGSGSALGVAAFVVATLVGGFLGAWYGGQDLAD
jgi:hypothetical protein